MAFNSAAHNKPSLIRDLLDTLLPNLYTETKVRVRRGTHLLKNTLLRVYVILTAHVRSYYLIVSKMALGFPVYIYLFLTARMIDDSQFGYMEKVSMICVFCYNMYGPE